MKLTFARLVPCVAVLFSLSAPVAADTAAIAATPAPAVELPASASAAPETLSAAPGTADTVGTAGMTATGSTAPGDIPAPEMSNEEAIAMVKLGVQLLKDGSWSVGLALLWLVGVFFFAKYAYPLLKGKLSDTVQKILMASLSFVTILATGIAGGLAIWVALVPAVLGSGAVALILSFLQKKQADDEA